MANTPQIAVRLDGTVVSRPEVIDIPARAAEPATDRRPAIAAREASAYVRMSVASELSVFDGAVSEAVNAIAEVRSTDLTALQGFGVGEMVSLVVTPYSTYSGPGRDGSRGYNFVAYRYVAVAAAAFAAA